jgi:hypothetical protein
VGHNWFGCHSEERKSLPCWELNPSHSSLGAFAASELDDDDRDGHQNVGTLRTPNAADSPRRLHEKLVIQLIVESLY